MKRSTRTTSVRGLLICSMLVSGMIGNAKPLFALGLTEGAKDSIFLQTLRLSASPQANAAQAYFSNKTKIKFVKGVCSAFRQGQTYKEVAAMIRTASQPCPKVFALEYMTSVTLAGVATYCPEYSTQLTQ